MDAVFDHSASKGGARLVLLSMADEANDEGLLTAYRRSHSHLARKANLDSGTVPRVVKSLVTLGELEVLNPGNGRVSTDYRIILPGLRNEGGQDAPPGSAPRAPTPRTTRPPGVQDAPPIIPLSPGDPPSPPSSPPAAAEVAFESFWNNYPRKTAKAEALKAWKLVIKTTDPQVILQGVVRYASDPNLPPPSEQQYIPHPSTWLRGHRWEDGPLPPRSTPRPGAKGYRPPVIDTDRTGPSRVLTEDDL